MPFYLIHAGTSLQKVSTAGALQTLSLPAGVSMVQTRPARFAILANNIVVTNAVDKNIVVNPATLATRLLTIDAPATKATAALAGAGNLNGTYRYKYTYAIISGSTVLTESPFSPISDPINASNNTISLSGVTASGTSGVTHRIIYRTTSNGADFFEAGRIADNSTTTFSDNKSDYDLGLLTAIDDRGTTPPGHDTTDRFRIITTWKDRLFASPANEPDEVWISGNREIWSWSNLRKLIIKAEGEDEYGVTAFMARRDELVIAKRRKLWKLIGTSPADFELILIAEGIGAVNQDSAIVIRDTCYFLGEDGYYEYGPDGVKRLSRDKVQPWFTTDDHFNRTYFTTAFAKYNALYDKIELHLPSAASTGDIDRWVEFDLKQKEWFGPHKTDAFIPTAGGAMDDADGFSTPIMGGSNARLYRQNQTIANDDGTPIDMDIITKFHSGNTPDIEKYWGELAVLTDIEDGGTLTITPVVGDLDSSPQSNLTVDLTKGRERLSRLGIGRFVQLRFRNSQFDQPVTILGYEIPFHEIGRR